MGGPFLQSFMDSLPSTADFNPGTGLTTAARTNDNAIGADPMTTGASTPNGISGVMLPHENVFVWLGVAVVALILYKAWSERNGEAHVSDVRVSLTNGLWGSLFVMTFIWIWRLIGGIGVKHRVPGSAQLVKFFAS